MKAKDLFEKYNYTPPYGGLDYSSNVEIIFSDLTSKGFDGVLELTKKEFTTVFVALKDEILVSMLLERNKPMNTYFKEGIQLRGFTIKLI